MFNTKGKGSNVHYTVVAGVNLRCRIVCNATTNWLPSGRELLLSVVGKQTRGYLNLLTKLPSDAAINREVDGSCPLIDSFNFP